MAALARLSADADAEIRDFATFALADLREDTPAPRATLRARLADEDRCARGEALRGLAERHDASITGQLRAELGG